MGNNRILIVDDAFYMRKRLKKILQEEGYTEIEEAVDGVEAIEKYKTFSPDYVFMDVIMPKSDGISAMKKIKEYDSSANVIMLSAIGQNEYILKAMNSGARHFVLKPAESINVIKVLNDVKEAYGIGITEKLTK